MIQLTFTHSLYSWHLLQVFFLFWFVKSWILKISKNNFFLLMVFNREEFWKSLKHDRLSIIQAWPPNYHLFKNFNENNDNNRKNNGIVGFFLNSIDLIFPNQEYIFQSISWFYNEQQIYLVIKNINILMKKSN